MNRIDTCKFHGSFRILYMQYSFSNLPYRYFNKCLVLYINFLISRQTSLIEVPIYFVVFHTTNINRLFSHCERLLFTSHKHLAFDFFMMIHHTTLLTTLLSSLLKLLSTKSLISSSIPKNIQLISVRPSKAEKLFCTRVIIFVKAGTGIEPMF